MCGACLLSSLLSFNENFLELLLERLDAVLLFGDLFLELILEGLKVSNLLFDEGDSLSNYIFALEDTLLGEDGADHFEHISVIIKHLKLRHDHLVLALFLRHLLFVDNDFLVF